MSNNFKHRLKAARIFSLLVIALGILLMSFMIVVEDEPGALPLLLLLFGTVCLMYTRQKLK